MARHKSLPQKFDHVLRLARRQALAGDATAYRMYLWLCDHEHKFVPERNICPLACQLSKVAGYKIMRDMGYRSA